MILNGDEILKAYRDGGISVSPWDENNKEIKMEKVHLEIGDIKIQFLNRKGEPWKKGDGFLRKDKFIVEGPGIDPNRVASVTIPKLSYSNSDLMTVEVEMYPTDPMNQADE